MKHLIKKSVGLQKQWLVQLCMMLMLLVAGSVVPVSAQRTISVNQAYEDSLRIVILWNNAAGNCTTMPNVGAQTRDTVLRALGITYNSNTRAITSSGTTNIRPSHVKVLMEDSTTNSTIDPTWNTIRGLWGGDSLPHVIVHVNAGWYT